MGERPFGWRTRWPCSWRRVRADLTGDGGGRRHRGGDVFDAVRSCASVSELERVLGPGSIKASLRARTFDVYTDQQSTGGRLKGGSLGSVLLLSIVQAMTECAFHDQVRKGNFDKQLREA